MKKLSKIIAAARTLTMVLPLCACGGQNERDPDGFLSDYLSLRSLGTERFLDSLRNGELPITAILRSFLMS